MRTRHSPMRSNARPRSRRLSVPAGRCTAGRCWRRGLKPNGGTPGERLRVGNWAFDCCLAALPGIVIKGEWGEPQISDLEWATAKELALAHMPTVFRPALKRPKFYNEDGQPFLRHCRD